MFSFQPLLVTIINDDDGNDCETHYPLCPYGKKCTYGLKCKYFHIERRHQNPLSITESLQMKARLEKSRIQQHLSTPSMMMNNGMMKKSSFSLILKVVEYMSFDRIQSHKIWSRTFTYVCSANDGTKSG